MRCRGRCRPSEAPPSGAAETSRARSDSPAHCCRPRFGPARCQPQTAPPIRARCLQAQATAEARLHRSGASAPAAQDLSSGCFSSARPPRARAPRSAGSSRVRLAHEPRRGRHTFTSDAILSLRGLTLDSHAGINRRIRSHAYVCVLGHGYDTVFRAFGKCRSQTRLSNITVPDRKPHRGAVEPQHEVLAYLHQSHRSGRRERDSAQTTPTVSRPC